MERMMKHILLSKVRAKLMTNRLKLHVKIYFVVILFLLAGCGGGGGNEGPSYNPDSGLNSRPTNIACKAFAAIGDISVELSPAFSNLVFSRPLALLQHPSDDQRWYVIEQSGIVRTFLENDIASTIFIDIRSKVTSGGEAGLLGMAFHPQFDINGSVYLSYTAPGSPLISRFSRVSSLDGGLTASIGSEIIFLSVNQPYSNHNGGWIAFGPDNYLHIGLGDGGSGGDPLGHGQNINTLLGSMLRIDVDNDDPIRGTLYSIPAGNPFDTSSDCTTGCPEISAWGFRNPWRWSFDPVTDKLWLGDVGQGSKEEIDIVDIGSNYGWKEMEGSDCYPPGNSCNPAGLTLPIVDYSHSVGNSVTGGYVYRGTVLPTLLGSYIYGDFGSGNIWRLTPDGHGGYINEYLMSSGLSISAFGQGRDGEVYIISYGDGRVYSLTQLVSESIPERMSETGYVRATDTTQPVGCFIPYEINAPFWSDGAKKERYFSIPENTYIDNWDEANWEMPIGSVVLKSFSINNQPIEMRLLIHHTNGQWAGYTYEWDSIEFDYIRVIGGKTTNVSGQTWIFPSESDCMRCHPAVAGRTLGLETSQLNRDFFYPSTGRTANQLTTYHEVGLFAFGLSDSVDNLPVLPNPSAIQVSLEDRAKSYLHTNCAQCHLPGGPTPSTMDLRFDTSFAQMSVCNAPVQGTALGIVDPLLVEPGVPDRSILLQRMMLRDANGMPPLASSLPDIQGADLLEQWITNLTICP